MLGTFFLANMQIRPKFNKNSFNVIFPVTICQITPRRVWRYQRGNQNPYTQWPKEKVQKDKQRSTKHTYKTKDRVTRTPLKTGGELRCSGRVSSSCSTSGTRRVNLVTNPVISREWGKDREVQQYTSFSCIWCLHLAIDSFCKGQ